MDATGGPEIVVVGSANVDYVVNLPRIPRAGETVLAHRLTLHEGGKGANQAVASARAGGAVAFIGAFGHDSDGDRLEASLARAGVTTRCMRVTDRPTGIALICVDDSGRNAISVVPGANHRLTPEHVEASLREFPAARTLLVQLEIPAPVVEAAIRLAAARGLRVILNPAPATTLARDVLEHVDVLTPNELEAELLTGEQITGAAGAAEVAQGLLAAGLRAVVITLGSRGAYVAAEGGAATQISGFRVDAVDTTGAGDVFNGALAAALTEGGELVDAVRFACAAAAISVTRAGAQASVPSRGEIEALLARTP